MGIIKRQSILSTLFIYIGFGIGALNTFLMPQFFEPEEIGITRIISSLCIILGGLSNLGTLQVMGRFFPYYRERLPIQKNDLTTRVLVINMLGFICISIFCYTFKEQIVLQFAKNSSFFVRFYDCIYLFTFFYVLYKVLESHTLNSQKTVITNVLRETVVRFFILLCIIAYALHWINYTNFIYIFSAQYLLALIIIALYLRHKNNLHFPIQKSTVTRRLNKHMLVYGSFVFGGSIFPLLEKNISVIFLGTMKSLGDSAVFDIGLYMATVLLVPQRSVIAIALPVIASAWKNKDLEKIDGIYKKSSVTLLIAGCFILGLIWLNMDNILYFLPDKFHTGSFSSLKYIALIIGIANLLDLGTGVNYTILSTSKYWKIDFYLIISQVFLFLWINYFLTDRFGMMGTAYAMLLAQFIYNATRCFLVWKKTGLQPFSWNTLWILCIAAGSYFMSTLFPHFSNVYIDALTKGLIFSIFFVTIILSLQISSDVNELANKYWRKLKL